MYKRYGDILAERARANTAQVVKKKVVWTAPPDPPWLKHTRPKHITYSFADGVYERPLNLQERVHIASGTSPRSPRSAGVPRTPRSNNGVNARVAAVAS